MTEGKRPGGLTALAVINFVFGGFGALSLATLVAMFALLDKIPDDEAGAELKKALEEVPQGIWVTIIGVGVVSTILIIASGVGYLKQKKFLGRGLGNAYALLGVANTLFMVTLMPPEAGGSFGIGTIIGLIYPILTLILINTSFKEDFLY